MSTLLDSDEADRRSGFRAVETQLELADALIRQDVDDVQRLVRQTMENMGVTQDQLQELVRQLQELGGMEDATAEQVARALGLDPNAPHPPDAQPPGGEPPSPAGSEPQWPPPPDDEPSAGHPAESHDGATDDAPSDAGEPQPPSTP
jgi:hypothetical protein